MTFYTHYRFLMQRHRADRVRFDPPLQLQPAWSFSNVGYPPKIYGGKAFVSFMDGRVRAFQETTGKISWTFQLPGGYTPLPPFDGDILVSEQTIITRYDDQLFVLDNQTGNPDYQGRVPPFNVRAAVLLGTKLVSVYVDESSAYFCFAYDLVNNAVLWNISLEWLPDFITAVGNEIFLSNSEGTFTCLDSENGKTMWSVHVKGEVTGIPTTFGDVVVVPFKENKIWAFHSKTGHLQWSHELAMLNSSKLAFYPDGRLYVLDHQNYYCLEAMTGDILYTKEIGKSLGQHEINMPTHLEVTENFIYFSDIYGGILAAMDKVRGEIVWTFKCKSKIPIFHAPTVLNGRLYLVDFEGNLYVFEEDLSNRKDSETP